MRERGAHSTWSSWRQHHCIAADRGKRRTKLGGKSNQSRGKGCVSPPIFDNKLYFFLTKIFVRRFFSAERTKGELFRRKEQIFWFLPCLVRICPKEWLMMLIWQEVNGVREPWEKRISLLSGGKDRLFYAIVCEERTRGKRGEGIRSQTYESRDGGGRRGLTGQERNKK